MTLHVPLPHSLCPPHAQFPHLYMAQACALTPSPTHASLQIPCPALPGPVWPLPATTASMPDMWHACCTTAPTICSPALPSSLVPCACPSSSTSCLLCCTHHMPTHPHHPHTTCRLAVQTIPYSALPSIKRRAGFRFWRATPLTRTAFTGPSHSLPPFLVHCLQALFTWCARYHLHRLTTAFYVDRFTLPGAYVCRLRTNFLPALPDDTAAPFHTVWRACAFRLAFPHFNTPVRGYLRDTWLPAFWRWNCHTPAAFAIREPFW